jgi:DNA mismatch repair ATPase MutS
LKIVNKYKAEFHKIYEVVGYLDSIIAITSYRKSLDYYCVPELKNYQTFLKFTDAYHPLIKKPVANSLDGSMSILLTGSNASGKSTFLKMAAINAIFSQTINTCLAKEYSSSYFIIYSSMALKDSIANNESYYIAEIKSLKRILDSLSPDIPCLCFIDEVLRGTNTVERIAASSQVLHELSKRNCLCIAATHDIELTSILQNDYENYHFQESLTDNDIVFDYIIYHGKSTTRNAIKLLKFMGYEDQIVLNAEDRAKRFEKSGSWTM